MFILYSISMRFFLMHDNRDIFCKYNHTIPQDQCVHVQYTDKIQYQYYYRTIIRRLLPQSVINDNTDIFSCGCVVNVTLFRSLKCPRWSDQVNLSCALNAFYVKPQFYPATATSCSGFGFDDKKVVLVTLSKYHLQILQKKVSLCEKREKQIWRFINKKKIV